MRMPSPVVARSRKITWPDCSPPSTRSSALHRGEHVAVADGRLDHVDARRRERVVQPEVRHHRDRDRVVAQPPRSCRSSAAITMIWSPSTMLPCSSTASTRSASPSNARPASAPVGDDRGLQRRAGRSNRTPALMFVPSGAACSTTTSAPSARNAAGPSSDAAPLAQSSTTRRPSSAPALDRRRGDAATYGAFGSALDRAAVAAAAAARRRRARNSSSIAPLGRVVELAAAGREELDAVVGPRVVARRDHQRRAAARPPRGTRAPGVGSTPASRTTAPSACSPAARSSRSRGPDAACRARRGTAARRRRPRAAARPSATTSSEVRSASASPRMPSVPKRSTAAPRALRASTASSTAEPCGPSSARTCAAPSRARHA